MRAIKYWSDKKLRGEYEGMKQLIEDIGIFGIKDLRFYDEIIQECNRRWG